MERGKEICSKQTKREREDKVNFQARKKVNNNDKRENKDYLIIRLSTLFDTSLFLSSCDTKDKYFMK